MERRENQEKLNEDSSRHAVLDNVGVLLRYNGEISLNISDLPFEP